MDQKFENMQHDPDRGGFSGSFPGDCCVQDQFLSLLSVWKMNKLQAALT